MPQFTYTVRDTTGKVITESITAANIEAAASSLRAQRYQILKLTQKSPTFKTFSRSPGKVSTVEKANLCRYLATMIKAGLPLTEAVASISSDTKNKALQNILVEVKLSLQKGEALSVTFAKYPQIFDQIFITIVRAGERSGTLASSFKYLQDQLTASNTLSQKVKSALIYPAVIISTMLAIGIILIVFVIPQIAQVFLSSNLPVPKVTTAILQGGLTLNQNLNLIGIGAGILILATVITFRSPKGRKLLLGLLKQVPGVVKLFEKLDLARFSRTLATLMKSGIPITQSLEVSTTTLSQKKFASLSVALKQDIKKGKSISSVLRAHQEHIPPMMVSMISTGEKTGTLDTILFDVANFFEEELEYEIKNFTAILEPVIMLIIGIGVGGMVLSIIAPIYSLVGSLQAVQ